MRKLALVIALLALSVGAGPLRVWAAEPEWHSDQPVTAGIEVPTPLGEVGDIEFWAPNRGLLITGGNSGMPAGIYAYDGTGWHLYSTVCGGAHGRIAWAGPDEFWTVSDPEPGENAGPENSSLCHFKDGEVVASYAEPTGQVNSYLRMDAAACEGPDDCWFGGERLSGDTNVGAFHLHWDGTTLTPVPALTVPEPGLADPGRAVFGMAFHQGQLYESVSVAEGDDPGGETEPAFFHRVDPLAVSPFEQLATPELSIGGEPEGLEGFSFARQGNQLWALSGTTPSGRANTLTMVRLAGASFTQVPLDGGDFAPGDKVGGFAMEPGADQGWVAFSHENERELPGSFARIAPVDADGEVGGEVRLPGPLEELNKKGAAGPVVCPAAGQCWMATTEGWLFHLGGPLPPDTDPAMHKLITFRPCDDSCRSGVETGLPQDTSGAEPETSLFPEAPEYEPLPTGPRKPHPLYTNLKQKVVDHTVLQLTFVLHSAAHVQLIAKRHQQVVAKTPRLTLDQGRHQVRLRLDPKRWPTHLSFQVHRIKKKQASR